MRSDISLVVFRPKWPDLASTLRDIGRIRSEFDRLYILSSGPVGQHARLGRCIADSGLERRVRLLERYDNLGFAEGHNRLLELSFADGAEQCLVLNPDIGVERGALSALMATAATMRGPCLLGPLLERQDAQAVIDSAGIRWTPTGRHFDIDQGQTNTSREPDLKVVTGITGACMLVSRSAHQTIAQETGRFFDEYLLAYREDAELGVRARLVGVPSLVSTASGGFTHRRSVRGADRSQALANLLGVRNRILIRWLLGRYRPGYPALRTWRDAVVVLAAATVERGSMVGVREAWRLRAAARARGRRLRHVSRTRSDERGGHIEDRDYWQ